MLHSSIESANPAVVIVERPALLSQQTADSPRESAVLSSRAGEEESSSPVCAAGWAY
jgi:hypothetical protein